MTMLKIFILAQAASAAIWGTDDTRLLWRASAAEKHLAQSVAHFVPKAMISTNPDGTKNIETEPLAETWNMCKQEAWSKSQSVFVGCTGFLIAPNLMLTAGHCALNHGRASREVTPFCSDFVWLFGFEESPAGLTQTKNIPADRFMECEEVIEAVHDSEQDPKTEALTLRNDYALMRLKTSTTRPFLKIAKEDPKALSTRLLMIGHPLGGPMRTSRGKILAEEETYWSTNLDSFGGNSGSPVLNADHEVIGILVRGYPDSLYDRPGASCSSINRCTEDGSKCSFEDRKYSYGEHVQKLPRSLLEAR